MTASNPPADSTPVEPSAADIAAGRRLAGRYRLVSRLASGGMAQVWEGTDEVLRRKVAVKLLHPHLAADASFVTRFRQEAVAAARLADPGIVAIYDTCSESGIEAIVMELVPGRTLRERLDEDRPVDPWQAAGLAAQVAEALDAAHRAGLVHRDIKPANILLAGDGRVKVADFGIAKAVAEADLTQPGLMVGTAKYLAPEQVEGKAVDARTDIYSLGVVLYEMLCGRPPFVADTDAATALARLQREPLRPRQVRPSVPKVLEEIVCRALAREPADRYASAAEMRAALLAAGADPTADVDADETHVETAPGLTSVSAPLPGIPEPPRPEPPAPSFAQSERGWLVPTAIVVAVALALGLAGVLIGRSGAGNLLENVRDAISGSGQTSTQVLTIAAATDFDPQGDGSENGENAGNVFDGDPSTSWRSEQYNDRDITALKPGFGLIVQLAEPADLSKLDIDSPTNDWTAEIYVASAPADDIDGWGEPVATAGGLAAGQNSVDLDGATGAYVLIWVTDRGDGPSPSPVEIREISLHGS